MKYTAVLAVAAAAATSFVAAQSPAEDITILQYALTLEHLEAKFYKDALAKFSPYDFQQAGYPAYVPQRLAQTAAQEAIHVATLSSVLQSLKQTPTAPCEYNFPYTNIEEFLSLAQVLEAVGVSAYLGKAPLIDNKAYLTAAGAILTVEARHQALISSFAGQDGIPSPFDTPLTGSQVFSLASPFIKNCPASNPTLPFKNFPDLKVNTKNPKIGERVSFHLPKTNGPVFVHFLNGLNDIAVQLDSKGGAILPQGLTGYVYVVATNSAAAITDPNTIAGPAVIVLPNPDTTYKKLEAKPNTRRAIEFNA